MGRNIVLVTKTRIKVTLEMLTTMLFSIEKATSSGSCRWALSKSKWTMTKTKTNPTF